MIYDLKCIIKEFAITFTLTTINPVVHRKIILHERQHHNEGIMTQKVAFIARNNILGDQEAISFDAIL